MRQLVQERENSEFKPVKLCLKIDLVSYPARAEGLVNIIMISQNTQKSLRDLKKLAVTKSPVKIHKIILV